MIESTKPKVRLSKVLLNLILSAAIVFGSMPCKPFVMEVKADTPAEKTITGLGLGTIMTEPNEPQYSYEGWKGSYVYFGRYVGKPMKYRVLACSENMILLDCDNILKDIQFSTKDNNNNSWKESKVRSWLQGDDFYNNTDVFTAAEKNAIHAGNEEIEGINDGIKPDDYTIVDLEDHDPVFVLNVSAVTNSRLGYYNDTGDSNTRGKYFLDENASKRVSWWWLRSEGNDKIDGYNTVGTVYDTKVRALSVIDEWVGVSPALYLKTAPILYSSLVNGSEGQAGSEYKLTVKDEGLSVSYNNVEGEDDTISVSYTFEDNSESADPTQISVVVTDKAWDSETKLNEISVIQYTKLAMDSFGSSGTGTFTLDPDPTGTFGQDYHVYILAEDVNGTYETDYASEPVELKPPVQASAEDVEVTYDGKPHSISVNITGDTEGVTVKYGSRADDCTKESGDLAITNVSDSPREIFYKVSKPGCLSASGSATVKINKAELIVSALDSNIIYGEKPQPSETPVRYGIVDNYGNVQGGFVNGEDESVLRGNLGFDYTYKQYDDVGKYRITPKGLTSDNYDIQFKPGRLWVLKATHPEVNVSGNAAYGTEGILELKEEIEAGGTLGSVSVSADENQILDGAPKADETRLRFKFNNNPENVGKKVKLIIPVSNPKNYGDYNIIAELEVISCDHSNKKLVEGTSKPGTCTQEGYEGNYRCPDCGAVIPGKNTPKDPENHDFAAVEVVKPATIITKGETKYRCSRCHIEKIVADIPCVEEGEEKDYDDLRKDVEGLSGDDAPKIEEKKDENGNTIETVTIGGEVISETVTDPESGKETIVSKVWIAGLEKTYTYTGSAIKPSIRVYDGTRKLIGKTDYTLSYKNNKEVGTDAQIIIKFKGSYSSSESKTAGFEIVKAKLGEDIIARDTGTTDEKKVNKTLPSLVWAETGKSVSSKFFDFEYGEVSGKECTVTIRPKTNYSGTYDKEATAKVRIVSDQNLLMSKARITFNPKSYAYTGKEITPSYKVTIGNTTLVKDADFTESIQNGIYPGTATLLIEAKPGNSKGYAGSKTATFRITGTRAIKDNADITIDVSRSVPFAKGGAKASVRVTDGTTVLKEGVDYTLSYYKNKAVTNGETAEVKIKGKGNYKGSVTKKFAVTKQQLSKLSDGVIIADQFTTRDKLKKPSVTITDLDGKNLSSSKDFEIVKIDKDDQANTDESGTVRVTIKGKGAYEGSVDDKSFRYMKAQADIRKATIKQKIADQTYTGYPVKLSNEDLTGVLSIGNTALEPGKDFIIDRSSYRNNNKKGTAKVTLIGTGAMAGRKTITFRIVQRKVNQGTAL